MKFSINQKKLLELMRKIYKIPLVKNNVNNIKNNNILLKIKNNNLIIIVSNLDIELIIKIDIIIDLSYKDILYKNIIINCKKFFNICKSLSNNENLTIIFSNDYLFINTNNISFKINTCNYNDFLNISNNINLIEFLFEIKISSNKLKNLIFKTNFSNKNIDKYCFNGILFEINKNHLRLSSTNGYMIIIYDEIIDNLLKNINKHLSIIIPKKNIIELNNLINYTDDLISIKIFNGYVKFSLNDFIFISKLIDDVFPNYSNLLEYNYNNSVNINLNNLKKTLSRILTLSSKIDNNISLFFKKNVMKIIFYNKDRESYKENFNIKYTNKNIKLGINCKYLLNILNIIKSENILLLFNDNNSIIKIEDINDKKLICIIMPVDI